MKNSNLKLLNALSWLSQLGLTVASPILLCLFGAYWLMEKFNLGEWILIVAIFLGLGGSVSGFLSFVKYFLKQGDNK